MLARKLKISTLKRQQNFIQERLEALGNSKDGNIAFTYVGHLYPEVKRHFELQGFDIKTVRSDSLEALTYGIPVYIFTPSNEITLTDTELEEAENYVVDDVVDDFPQEITDWERALAEVFFGDLKKESTQDEYEPKPYVAEEVNGNNGKSYKKRHRDI